MTGIEYAKAAWPEGVSVKLGKARGDFRTEGYKGKTPVFAWQLYNNVKKGFVFFAEGASTRLVEGDFVTFKDGTFTVKGVTNVKEKGTTVDSVAERI